MAKMILSMDGLVLKEIVLNKERMTIGRKASNDIQIDSLAISGQHAAIVTILNDSFLEDLNSTNGTLVNGQPAKKHFLQDGDAIELGKYKLKYVAEPLPRAEAAEFEKTVVVRPASLKPMPAAVDGAFGDSQLGEKPRPAAIRPAAASAVRGGFLQVVNGVNAGRELDLTKTLTTVGKPGVQVAVIAKRPQGYFITHVEGATFPLINGLTLDRQAVQLADHDLIEIAGIKMAFVLKND